ncbi:MAG: bifunctional metallophosphatase/5'-nucleotidase [Anaerolineae bacterium]
MAGSGSLAILQMNDSHAYLELHQELFWQGSQAEYRPAGGYARIATLVHGIRATREGQVLFCDCGDTLHGTYPAVKTQGKALVPVLNALGIHAMTAHWESAYGPAVFKQRAEELDYPTLALNIYEQASQKRYFRPYCVEEVGGLRIGLVGIASNIIDKTMPPAFSEGLRFSLGREELPEVIETLHRQEKVDLVVLVSHLGFPQDVKLLTEVQGVDVCLSGHTHHRLATPVRQGNTLIIQSGAHGSFLGRLEVEVVGGRIVDYRHQLIEVSADVLPDPEVEGLVQQALAPYRQELSAVVGETATPLNRATMLESTMDNLLLQALCAATGAELAFSNGWRYGAPVVAGPVTLNDLYNIIPMNPPISTVALTGDELVTMLEENLERSFAADPYDQMGGYVKRALRLNAYIKIENPRGQRIQQLFVGGQAVDPKRTYQAAYVTEQGVGSSYGQQRQEHTMRAVQAMQAYLAEHRPAHAELRGTFVAV